jgi:hypothetical protein
MYERKYVSALEDLIMDELLPMYIVGCRSTGIDPRANAILAKLMDARKLREEIPWILKAE